MSQDQGITVGKSQNFSEWFTQVVEKADLADVRYGIQGFIVHRTWSMRIIKQMIKMIEDELESDGHEPVLFPLVIPEENLRKEGDHFGFLPEVYWVTERGAHEKMEKRLALRPTSESAFYPMYSLWVRSHRDLPLKKYQSVTVYRNEPVTRPFIRGHEFIWVEAHDVFETHDEALRQVERDVKVMRSVMVDSLGIPILTLKRPRWDKFLGAEDTYANDVLMPDSKVMQIGSTHDLGQKFSVPFGIRFLDREQKEQHAWQTCFGPGVWRMFAALVAIHGDDKGLVLPFKVAPIQVVIVPILYDDKNKEKIRKKCASLKKSLGKEFRVFVDDSNKTPGEKYNKWEMFGVPFRIEVGSKEASRKFVTLHRRDTGERSKVTEKQLQKTIVKISDEMLKNMRKRAEDFLESNTSSPKNKHDFLRAAGKGGIVRVAFCGSEDCARDIQNETGGLRVRGTLFGKVERALGKCVYCNKSAREVVYMAKQY